MLKITQYRINKLIYTCNTYKEGHAVPKARGILTPLSRRFLPGITFTRNVMLRSPSINFASDVMLRFP